MGTSGAKNKVISRQTNRQKKRFNILDVVRSIVVNECILMKERVTSSSAYECPVSPELAMTSNSSAVYNRNRSGPMTDPCGTPKSSRMMAESRPA